MKLYFPIFPDDKTESTFTEVITMYNEYMDAKSPKHIKRAQWRATRLPTVITFLGILLLIQLHQRCQMDLVLLSAMFLVLSISIMLFNQRVIQPYFCKKFADKQHARIAKVAQYFHDPATRQAISSTLQAMNQRYEWYQDKGNYDRHFEEVDNTDYRYFRREYLCYQEAYQECVSILEELQKQFTHESTRGEP